MTLSERIKSEISIIDVANKYIKVESNNRSTCPFHKGKNLSLSFDTSKNSFKCFKCEETGSVIDFVMKIENIGFKEAIKIISERYNINENEVCSVNKVYTDKINHAEPLKKESNVKTQLTSKTLEIYTYFDSIINLSDKGKEYLKIRHIDSKTIDRFKIKSIDDPIKVFNQLKENFPINELKEAGFITRKGNFIFWLPAIIFSYYRKGKPVYFSSRNLTGNIKSFKMTGVKERFFVGNTSKEKIYLLEGIFDGLSLYVRNNIDNFICLNGTMDIKKIEKIKRFYSNKKMIHIFDNDITGALSRMKLEENQKILSYNWECKTNIYENIKTRFNSYDKAREFFIITGNRDLPEYKAIIKDLNDSICKIEAEKQAPAPIKKKSISKVTCEEISFIIDYIETDENIKLDDDLIQKIKKYFTNAEMIISKSIKSDEDLCKIFTREAEEIYNETFKGETHGKIKV